MSKVTGAPRITVAHTKTSRRKKPAAKSSAASNVRASEHPYSFHGRWSKVLDTLFAVMESSPKQPIIIYPLIDVIRLLFPKPRIVSLVRDKKSRYELIQCSFKDSEYYDRFCSEVFLTKNYREFAEVNALFPLVGDVSLCFHKIEIKDRAIKSSFSVPEFVPYHPRLRDTKLVQAIEAGGDAYDVQLVMHLMQALSNPASSKCREALKHVFTLVKPTTGNDGGVIATCVSGRAASHQRTSKNARRLAVEQVPLGALLVTDEQALELLQPVRRVIDLAQSEIKEGLIFSESVRDTAGPRLTNLFCVVQTATIAELRRQKFNYTARLLLGEKQKDAIQEWLASIVKSRSSSERKDAEALRDVNAQLGGKSNRTEEVVSSALRALETPLGPNYRSIADSVLCSGVTDVSSEIYGTGRDGHPGFKSAILDESRQQVEKIVYGRFGAQHVFYAAIHVGGVPWLAALTLANQPLIGISDDDANFRLIWGQSYHFYRDIIPLIARQIRTGVRQVFFDHLYIEFINCARLYNGARLFDEVNRRWRRLVSVFPYELPILRLTSDRDGETVISLPAAGVASIDLEPNPNPCFMNPLAFDRLNKREILAICKRAAEESVRHSLEISTAEATAWAHEISNAVIPPYSALDWVQKNGHLNAESATNVRHAMQWILFMGATARIRNRIGDFQTQRLRGARVRPPGSAFAGLEKGEIREIVDAVLQYLLASHARENINEFELVYRSENGESLSADEAFESLKRWKDTTRYHIEDVQVFFSEKVIWPLALLRELVQNIQINRPIEGDRKPKIEFFYRWADSMDERTVAVLETVQEQTERHRWFEGGGIKLVDGLRKANDVYGPDGACFGDVQPRDLLHTPDPASGAFRIRYQLDVRFFRADE